MISLISCYHNRIDLAISKTIESFGPKTKLRDAIEYALKNGGKRFRPSIVYMVAKALGKAFDVTDSALAIEFFHTASLIADDLPCMDDDDERRNCPTLHKAYDEATAVLATYALIAAGYDRIRQNAQTLKQAGVQHTDTICVLALENATYNTGIFGAVGGQFFDLFPQELKEEHVREVINKKTGTLFEISFVFGWLFGGGVLSELERVKKTARHFGMAFQISDDLLDLEQDKANNRINYPATVSIEKAFQTLSHEVFELKRLLKELRLDSPEILALVEHVTERVSCLLSL